MDDWTLSSADGSAARAGPPGFGRRILRLIVDRNPFYLLSGGCMLAGCYLLSVALYTKAGNVGKLLVLLGTVNVYELLIVGLGLLLIRHPVFRRDGRILLALEALFLADITFTAGVLATVDARWGLAVVAGLLVLAGVKVALILRPLRVREPVRLWAFFMAQTAALLAVPAAFKLIANTREGFLSPLAVYGGWWLAGLLPVLGLVLYRRSPALTGEQGPVGETGLARVYALLPFASLLVHLYSAAWVYSIPFRAAFISPVVLGLAVALTIFDGTVLSRWALRHLQAGMAALAVGLSVQFPHSLLFGPTASIHLAASPLRLVLMGVALMCLYAVWRDHWWACAVVASLCLAGVLLGPSLAAMWSNLAGMSIASAHVARESRPRTAMEWGVATVGASFALLVLGAAVSLLKVRALQRAPTEQSA
jgi:hypothetical protein